MHERPIINALTCRPALRPRLRPPVASSGVRRLALVFAASSGVRWLALVFAACLWDGSAIAQLALPVESNGQTLPNLVTELTYTVDMGTLPQRPVIVVEVSPDVLHTDIQLEIEATNWLPPVPPGGSAPINTTDSFFSAPSSGDAYLEVSMIDNVPVPGGLVGHQVDVIVRVLSFGSGGAPADVDVTIRGETRVPTGTIAIEVETDISPQTVFLDADKDTTIYASNSAASNGAGVYMWAGTDYEQIGVPPFVANFWNKLNGLLSFPVVSTLPWNAVVSNADLQLYVVSVTGGGGTTLLYETAPGNFGAPWYEGNANASGSEFLGAISGSAAADWFERQGSTHAWTTAGGDVVGGSLSSLSLTTTGYKIFSSPAINDTVQGWVDDQDDSHGFTVRGPGSTFFFFDIALRFASSEHPTSSVRPELRVDYAPAAPYADGTVNTGVVSFIGEGEDFGWIYDIDDDGLLSTTIGGLCEVLDPQLVNYLPYTYSYSGTPGYVGLDCCAWKIDAPETNTTGVGQAVFYHNLDPNNPANDPPDTDGDAIFDLCDNCVNVPNGPALGTCIGPAGVSNTCMSDLECSWGATCQFSQQDADLDEMGDACQVPEPGLGLSLFCGLGALVGLSRRRERCT